MATKSDIIAKFAAEFGVTKVQAESMCAYVLDIMHDLALEDGHAVFGPHKMVKKVTAPRKGRNPQTGESMDIPSKTKVQYKALNR